MSYPDDIDFEDRTISGVERNPDDGTYSIETDGWHMWCGKECPLVPEVGQIARFYPGGIGFEVRGLFINGVKIWYRTEAEQKEHSEIQMYGADAADWLKRWDSGDGVWSIEMGGIGPGYEQAIQITTAEILRFLLDRNPAAETFERENWPKFRDELDQAAFKNPVVDKLGLSGSQFGAATNLACMLYRRGPRAIMNDEAVKDRHIQVSRSFPSAA